MGTGGSFGYVTGKKEVGNINAPPYDIQEICKYVFGLNALLGLRVNPRDHIFSYESLPVNLSLINNDYQTFLVQFRLTYKLL